MIHETLVEVVVVDRVTCITSSFLSLHQVQIHLLRRSIDQGKTFVVSKVALIALVTFLVLVVLAKLVAKNSMVFLRMAFFLFF